MKDIFNIVKVSDIDDVDCQKIIKKCYDKPNMINYYYPHIFMNRDKIDKNDLIKTFEEYIENVKRDKNVEQTIKKYNTLTAILESLFLCVLDISAIKQTHKYIQYTFSKDDNNIIDIVNHIINEKPLYNLEQLLNDKIDNTNSVYIIEKIIEHIKKCYTNDNLEKQTINQYQLLSNMQHYIFKQKFIPYINKIINFNKKELIKEYITKCIINDSHDEYIGNIVDYYQELKVNAYDIQDDCDWNVYFKKISTSLNIDDPKEKIIKCIFRFNILNKIFNIYSEKSNEKDTNKVNVQKNILYTLLQSIIDTNNIDKVIVNSYIYMVKNNCAHDKLIHLENIIKYFSNYSNLSKELINLIIPKYFNKEKTTYYMEVYNRLNTICNKKLSVVDNIIEQQKKFVDDLKITQIDNESKSIFDKDIISLFNLDSKYIDSKNIKGQINNFTKELKGYNTFTKLWFERIFSGLKKISISQNLSNGKMQIDNTIINTNLIILNALFMFNNPTKTVSIDQLKQNFSEDLIDDIINTFEYYKIANRIDDKISLNTNFFTTKQEIKIELIKKVEQVISVESNVQSNNNVEDKNTMIECYILKSIKPNKVHKDNIFNLVSQKCGQLDKDVFDKCMKRLFVLDYYEIIDDHLVYVP